MYLKPKSTLGKWSVWLIVGSVALGWLMQLLVFLGQRGSEFNLLLLIPGILIAIFVVASFFTGIISITKQKERALFVFMTTILSFFAILLLAGELLAVLTFAPVTFLYHS